MKEGVKHNNGKIELSKILIQFPDALKAVMLASTFGHIKYEETDKDWLNFKKVKGGSETFKDAMVRHLASQEELEPDSGLPPQFHWVWNALSHLQLWIEEQDIDVDESAKTMINKWRS